MSKLSISRLLSVFALIVTTGLLAALFIQNHTLSTLRVNGPIYRTIEDQKDFMADILPPPLFVSEAYATAYEAHFHAERRADALKRLEALKLAYDASRARWMAASLDPDQRQLFETGVVKAADSFWTVLQGEFKAVIGADQAKVEPVMEKLADAYIAQRGAAAELNERAAALLAQREKQAGASSSTLTLLALAASVGSILVFIGGVILIRVRAISPLAAITDIMRRLSEGSYDVTVPYAERRDEIGNIAAALGVFRKAGLAKQDLEREAEAALVIRREKRIAREAESEQRAAQVQHVVDTLGESLERLSNCNIRMTIDEAFPAEFDGIRHNFNRAIAAIQITLERVLDGTQEIREGTRDLNTAADDMSRRTEQQAAALEETAASLEQINSTIATLAANTRETRILVSNARTRASGSAEVVGNTVAAMQRIEDSARQIGQIIGVIDEIAFQTNLLALNAGVEAARAGEAGKGFAVVAQEVRELAQRSAGAARQIKDLVAHSALQVGEGVKLVDETGRVLTEITGFVARIDDTIETIANGMQEQATGIRDTTSAINELDVTTQRNAAMAQETSLLSRSLAEQAQLLAEEAGKFQLNRREEIRAPGAPAGARRRAA